MVIRDPNAIYQAIFEAGPETRSIRGIWPVIQGIDQIVAGYRGGHGVDQRMIVQGLMGHHGWSSTTVTRPCRIVEGPEWRHRTRLHAQTSRSRSEEPNENRPLAPSVRCRPFRSISASSSATTR